eukprot:SAG11_NODE_10255_length_843_cov_64.948925_1_plen_129_part_00
MALTLNKDSALAIVDKMLIWMGAAGGTVGQVRSYWQETLQYVQNSYELGQADMEYIIDQFNLKAFYIRGECEDPVCKSFFEDPFRQKVTPAWVRGPTLGQTPIEAHQAKLPPCIHCRKFDMFMRVSTQ